VKALDPATVPLVNTFLIEASAGTGKTYTITSLFLRLVLEGYSVDTILVVTFTEAATAELRERIRSRLREALDALHQGHCSDPFLSQVVLPGSKEEKKIKRRKLLAALSGFDEAAIWTIHGFCRRVLQDHAFESGALYDAELVTDQQPLFDQVVADFWTLEVSKLPGPWVRYLQKKITPSKLSFLLKKITGHSALAILPKETTAGLTVADFMVLYNNTKHLWHQEKEKILTLLETHPGVNRRSFTKTNRTRWAKEVDAYLSLAEPSRFPEEGGLGKFRQSKLLELYQKLGKKVSEPRHPFFENCEELCCYPVRWLIGFQKHLIEFARNRLRTQKKEQGIYFFNDLIHDLEQALDGQGGVVLARGIRRRFRAALIDEFQDTDQAQYRIFKAIFQNSKHPFFLIGDPKQSIYAFRGADIFAYLQAAKDAKDRSATLTVNWRSDPGLIGAINTLFQEVPSAFGFKEVLFHSVTAREGSQDAFLANDRPSPPLQILHLKNDDEANTFPIPKEWTHRHLPKQVAAHISKLIFESTIITDDTPRKVGPGDVAVLVRTNRQAGAMQAALRQYGIPSVLSGSDSVFSSIEAYELWQVLRAVGTPGNDTQLRNALSTSLFGFSAINIDELRHDDTAWNEWVGRFWDWHRLWQQNGFIPMMESVFEFQTEADAPPLLLLLLSQVGGERQVTNFKHLSELLHGIWMEEQLGMTGMMRWFEKQRTEERRGAESHELRLESDATAVQLVTIHKSKGLEYPVVVAPYLWDGGLHGKRGTAIFHDPAFDHRLSMDLSTSPEAVHRKAALWEEMAENMRLLYVALTRARHHCVVVWGAVKEFETSALGFLLHHPKIVEDYASVQRHIGSLDEAAMERNLAALVPLSKGVIAVSALKNEDGIFYQPEEEKALQLSFRKVNRSIGRRWRFESYSHLVSRAGTVLPEEELERDWDRQVAPSNIQENRMLKASFAANRVPFADFEQGATAGSFFHSIYEDIDFTLQSEDGLGAIVQEKLSAFGFDKDTWSATVSQTMVNTLACQLDAEVPALSLNKIKTDDRLNELGFVFPVSNISDRNSGPVEPIHIAEMIARYGGSAIPKGYEKALFNLSFSPMQGFLKGFIDLVFCFEGRWYIVDYKSNYLGATFEDYSQEKITTAMADHHYFLQYHLYVTALHRYLSYRLDNYDYDTHMGKVYYLFIRGMTPAAAPGFSVFQDRPPKLLIEGLSGLFGEMSTGG
jgi:exodeoxyribonuclease V beta subunit